MSQDVNYTFIFAGEFGVGKTSIFKRIQTGKFSDQSSVLLDAVPLSGGSDGELEHYIYRDTLDGINFKISLWDTGGLEKFRSMTSSYYRYSVAIILVYDSSPERIGTLFRLDEWIREARERSFIKDRVVLSLWASKSEESQQADTAPEVAAFMQEHGIPDCLHFRVSAKTGLNVIDSLNSLIRYVHRSGPMSGVVYSGSEALSGSSATEQESSEENRSQSIFSKCVKC